MDEENRIADSSDKFADQVMNMIPDDHVSDLAKQAQSADADSTFERLEIAVNSGVYLGARVGFQLVHAELAKQAGIIGVTLKAFDDALQKTDDPDHMMVLADLRRPIAKFLEEQRGHTLNYLAAAIESRTMVPAHVIQDTTPVDHINGQQLFAIGASISLNVPRAFAGFLMYRDDDKMECKCIYHLQMRFEGEGLRPSDVPRSEDSYQDMIDFGKHMVLRARESYASAVEELDSMGGSITTSFTQKEAELAAKDVIAKMTGGGQAG